MIDEVLFEKVSRRIDQSRQDMIELQKALTAVPAVGPANGGDGEMPKALALKKRLVKMGFTIFRHFDAPDPTVSGGLRPNFLTSLPGKDDSRRIWIITHLDIVPPGEPGLWSADPYRVYVKDDCVYGRGTEDNQQDMVASVFAARALLEEGIPPPATVNLLFVSDEETSSEKGVQHLLGLPEKIFSPGDWIVAPDSGNSEGSLIEVAEKGILWLGFRTTGKQCHGSKPQLGINAFSAASRLVIELTELCKIFDAADPLFDPPVSTFEPTKKEANVGNINTIPGEDVFYMDCRILPCYRIDDVLSEIKKITKSIETAYRVTIEISIHQRVDSAPSTPADAPVVRALTDAVNRVYQIRAFAGGVGAGTVAAYFRKQGLSVAVWSKTNMKAHQPDENCPIGNMTGDAKVFAHLFLQA
ncbi:MAG TPA: M20 family metallo-hydrolase [Smithellaceae bacterium]|nr:M20 family metallo-hydrolase [Syntrophaceae bacterium]NMC92564.1 M20 family metallo-hydrolase [Smithella sp.]HOE21935.1 M20 family metallo-hydrolase [Smithellaceae bacterium]MBP9530673.1 M20 family metallo-hydrolase [Syntrophaceae bacterium]HOU55367.1 M20 family metallo-hydrolase [Smithellaceae bacterium]